MPRYLYQGTYSGDGCRGIVAEGGSQREAETRAVFERVGGTVEVYEFAFAPGFDFVIIADLPDAASALIPPLLASATGTVAVRATPLISPGQLDEISAAARGLTFRAAGS